MSDVVAVYRHLIGADGSKIVHLLRVLKDEQLADEFIEYEKAFVQELAKLHVVELVDGGRPRGVATLPAMFGEIGIANIAWRKVTLRVYEANLVEPRTVVTLQ